LEENFIIIPESIYRDERLSPRAVLLYGLVLSLSQNGFCWANNRFFAERLGVSKDRVSRIVSELAECGFVRLSPDPDSGTRRIYPLVEKTTGIGENTNTPCQKNQTALVENANHRKYSEQNIENTSAKRKRFQPPSVSEVADYCREHSLSMDAERFVDYYTANGWMAGRSRMRDWQAAARNWARREQPNTPAEPEMKFVN